MEVGVTVCRRHWRMVHDPKDEYRVRHFVRFTIAGVIELKSTRISASMAETLVQFGAEFEDDPKLSAPTETDDCAE